MTRFTCGISVRGDRLCSIHLNSTEKGKHTSHEIKHPHTYHAHILHTLLLWKMDVAVLGHKDPLITPHPRPPSIYWLLDRISAAASAAHFHQEDTFNQFNLDDSETECWQDKASSSVFPLPLILFHPVWQTWEGRSAGLKLFLLSQLATPSALCATLTNATTGCESWLPSGH